MKAKLYLLLLIFMLILPAIACDDDMKKRDNRSAYDLPCAGDCSDMDDWSVE